MLQIQSGFWPLAATEEAFRTEGPSPLRSGLEVAPSGPRSLRVAGWSFPVQCIPGAVNRAASMCMQALCQAICRLFSLPTVALKLRLIMNALWNERCVCVCVCGTLVIRARR